MGMTSAREGTMIRRFLRTHTAAKKDDEQQDQKMPNSVDSSSNPARLFKRTIERKNL